MVSVLVSRWWWWWGPSFGSVHLLPAVGAIFQKGWDGGRWTPSSAFSVFLGIMNLRHSALLPLSGDRVCVWLWVLVCDVDG